MSINLKLLHTFARVAQLRSFKRAAEELGRTSSAISMQISELEGQIGLKLLERTTRNVTPTPDGATLLEHVQDSMKSLETGIAEARDAAERRKGRVVFGCAPTVAANTLASVLTQFRASFPDVSLHIREMTSTTLLPAVRNREIDFGITPFVQAKSDLTFKRLLREPLVALVSVHHFPGLPDALSLEHLAKLPLLVMQGMPVIALHDQRETSMLLTEFLESCRQSLNIACSVRQAATLVDLAASGLGIGIVPKLAVPAKMAQEVRMLPLTEPQIVRDIGIATLKGEVLSEPSVALARIFKEQLNHTGASEDPTPDK
ncbi:MULTISPECIES: LysR family transcriptional regulator [Halomonadaceae]|uniref:LysR family transcriptional regulator n=1 Tax=Halomonadaceae TaxID=28256 RepID=UPI00158166EF|nr:MULTISPECIES: LysR family transcriptional regulator [Halomonas]MDI4637405.1 LysR family transcriptional regulator [Halomonas sp. BMC7]NUJ61240.1 LysR family transcriptional regulator [Halomonas taeanensis]|tara:strand:- start:11758 stop:12705 length:948 start_codon:yes stop_codon:yes gene_type:complete